MLRIAALAAAAAGAFAAVAAPGTAAEVISFRTPSGNIGCYYAAGLDSQNSIRCDIRTGLRPRPAKPARCDLDWGDSYELAATGRAILTCHGDTAINPHARVLRYGSTWRRGGLTCASRVAGLRCHNRSGHGFFLSRQHSYRF